MPALPFPLFLRLLRRLTLLTTLALLCGIGWLWVKAPPVLAAYCPQCFGFSRIGPGLWVDNQRRAQLLGLSPMAAFARADVAQVFGPGSADVPVLMCTMPACAERMKRPDALGAAYGQAAILLTPFGLDPIVLRHELTHVARLEITGRFARRVIWREEGLAEWVAKGPRLAEDCPPARALPETSGDWQTQAARDVDRLYTEAHCRILREIDRRGVAAVALQP